MLAKSTFEEVIEDDVERFSFRRVIKTPCIKETDNMIALIESQIDKMQASTIRCAMHNLSWNFCSINIQMHEAILNVRTTSCNMSPRKRHIFNFNTHLLPIYTYP